MATNASKTVVKKGAILFSRIYASEFQKEGSLTCELKQTVETTSFYPAKTVSNSLSDNLFSADEFGYEEQEFKSERTDVAWILVPEGTDEKKVMELLAKVPEATLYRITSNKPILSDEQKYAINQKIATLDTFANAQVVRHGSDDADGKWKEGDLVLDKLGRPLYKAVYFSKTKREDVNLCTEDPADFYASPEITAEMNVEALIPAQSL